MRLQTVLERAPLRFSVTRRNKHADGKRADIEILFQVTRSSFLETSEMAAGFPGSTTLEQLYSPAIFVARLQGEDLRGSYSRARSMAS